MKKRYYILFGIIILGLVIGVYSLNNSNFEIKYLDYSKIKLGLSADTYQGIGTLTTSYLGKEWNTIKSTGEESNLIFWSANAKDKKTEIGWIPISGSCMGLTDKNLYDENNNLILDDKGKEIVLKCESSKCNGQNCYHISLTEAQAINIDDYVRLGENSIISVYQDINQLEYNLDWANANITLYKNISGNYDNKVNDIWVYYNEESYKFGANDSFNENIENYKYSVVSTEPIIENNLKPYIKNPNIIHTKDYSYYEGHEFDFSDICNRKFECWVNGTDEFGENITICNKSADCNFNYSNEFIIYNETYNYTLYYLDVIFNSDKDIDPLITISETDVFTKSLLINVTVETGDSNHTHLNISDEEPWNHLGGYWSFDGDLENTEGTTAYDWSGNGNDGTYTHGGYAEEGGIYGKGFNGTEGGISLGDDVSWEGSNNLSISWWYYANSYSTYDNQFTLDTEEYYMWRETQLRHIYMNGSGDIKARQVTLQGATGVYNYYAIVRAVSGDVVNWTFYRNGNYITSYQDTEGYTPGDANFYFGDYGGGHFNDGIMDEVMIFNTSLTAQQIQDIYNNQSARFKSEGEQRVRAVNINQTGNYNKVNLTSTFDKEQNSNLTARIGQLNLSIDTTGLVGYWPFEWGSAVDISGYGNDGTLEGDVSFNKTGGRNETGGFEFDGDGDYVDCGNDASLQTPTAFTANVWVNRNGTDQGEVLSKGNFYSDDWAIRASGDGGSTGYRASVGTQWALDSDGMPGGEWVMITLVYEKDVKGAIYTNGVWASNLSTFSANVGTARNLFFGSDYNNEEYFNGTIDDVMIFNRSLSAEEISLLYNETVAKHDSTPYYTEYKEMTSGENTTFDISTSADFIFPDYKFEAGSVSGDYDFYSPVLFGDSELFVFEEAVGPPDTSFTVTLPANTLKARYNANNASHKELAPDNQTDSIPFMNVTNTGNTNLDFNMSLNASLPNGIELRADTDNNPNGANKINETSFSIYSGLGQGNSFGIWFWSYLTNADEQNTYKNLTISTSET